MRAVADALAFCQGGRALGPVGKGFSAGCPLGTGLYGLSLGELSFAGGGPRQGGSLSFAGTLSGVADL